MTVKVHCPNPDCRLQVQVAEHKLGKRGRCRQCGTKFVLAVGDDNSKTNPQVTLATLAAGNQTKQRLGRFEVRRRLGAGAFGAVYLAYDPQLERDVALKVPHVERMNHPQFVKRFLNEAKTAARLQHPHIVPVFDAASDGEQLYIASAFIVGKTLEERLGGEPLDCRDSARIVMRLAEALAYAHKQGIVHRDVKPANIMLDERGEPHLMDFGLARVETSEERLTQDGSVMGTPAYMSPEQARGATDDVGASSDQYSLGATLYETLTGELPFNGPPEVVIFNVIHQEPVSPQSFRRTVPGDLDTICLKAMAKLPAERYAGCEEFAADLRRWLDDEPIAARPLNRMQRLVRWGKKEPIVAGLIVAVFVVTLLGFAGVFAQWRKARNEALIASKLNRQLEDRQRELETANEAKEHQRVEAIQQRDAALHNLYAAKIGLAFVEANKDHYGTTPITTALRSYLASAASLNQHQQLSGWEWHYLNSINLQPVSESEIPRRSIRPRLSSSHPSPDLSWVTLQQTDRTDILDARSGELVSSLPGADDILSWSPDSTKIVAADLNNDRRFKVFDASSGRILREFEHPTTGLKWAYWSPDQKSILTRHATEVSVWNASDGELIRTITTPKPTRALAWHPEGHWIAIAFTGGNGPILPRVSIYDVSTGDEVRTLSGREHAYSMAWSPDGKYFAYCDFDVSPSHTCVFETVEWKKLATLHFGGHHIRWHPKKPWLCTINGAYSNNLKIHVVTEMAEYSFHFISDLTTLRWSTDGTRLFTMSGATSESKTSRIAVWDDLAAHSHAYKMRANGAESKGTFSWSPDGQQFAVIGGDSSLTVYDIANYESVATAKIRISPPVWSSWNENGQKVAVATKNELVILNGTTLDELRRLNALEHEITCAVWLPESERIAAGYADGTVKIWDTKSENTEDVFSGDGDVIKTIDAHSDGAIAIGSQSGRLRLQSGSGEHNVAILGDDLGELSSIAFDPEGKLLALLTSDGVIQLWDLSESKMLRSWQAHDSGATHIAWSPDGRRLASAGGRAKSLRIWDPAVGLELTRFNETLPVWWTQWSPDGRRLAYAVGKDQLKILTASLFGAVDLSSAKANQKE